MIHELSAVITGASSGIGKAIAMAIAATGGSVCLVGRDAERLAITAEEAQLTARAVLVFQADLSADCGISNLAQYVEQSFSSFNALVHCAGAHVVGRLEEISVNQLDALYRINVRTPYALTQALLPLLKSRQGQTVFMNSSQGLRVGANTGAYASTKHALKAITDSLRQEVNAQGVRVLSIYPGRTATPTIKALCEREGRPYRPELLLQPEDIAKVVVSALQLPRTAEVTNIEIRPLAKSY
jgi:NADP-dependent 3-hydroxy acid dehydrogenase YdfG